MNVISRLPVKIIIGILTVALAFVSVQPVEQQTAFEEKAFLAGSKNLHGGKDHPEDCIKSKVSGAHWPSAYSRDVWYYNVAPAVARTWITGHNTPFWAPQVVYKIWDYEE